MILPKDFWKKHTDIDHIFNILPKKLIMKRESCWTFFVDLTEVCDSLSNEILFRKLYEVRACSKISKPVKSLYLKKKKSFLKKNKSLFYFVFILFQTIAHTSIGINILFFQFLTADLTRRISNLCSRSKISLCKTSQILFIKKWKWLRYITLGLFTSFHSEIFRNWCQHTISKGFYQRNFDKTLT